MIGPLKKRSYTQHAKREGGMTSNVRSPEFVYYGVCHALTKAIDIQQCLWHVNISRTCAECGCVLIDACVSPQHRYATVVRESYM